MTINAQNISTAIYALIWAFNCQENKNIVKRIHIEDELPIEQKASIMGVSPIMAIMMDITVMGMAVNKEQSEVYGYADLGEFITFFYKDLLKQARKEEDLLVLALEYVKHELRHVEQFRWLRAHGINPTEALLAERNYEYGQGPLERDAWAAQKGATTPIDEAMACFLH